MIPGAGIGAGIVLGGIAINLTSALVQELWLAQDDDTRADVVERGLAERDADMTTLAAAALLHAGPDLALALPDTTRTDLLAGLERAMRAAGGPLDAIAPRYIAALRDPQTDWAALQVALRQTIHDTRMLMEVGHEGVISGGTQRAENTAGRVDMTMRGGDRARLENVEQIASTTRPPARTCPDCGAAVRDDQRSCARCGLPLTA